MMTLPLTKSWATSMSTHIRLTLVKKPLTVMRIDGGVKRIGSAAQKLHLVPSLLVWEKKGVQVSSLPALNWSAVIRRSGQAESSSLIVCVILFSHSVPI